MLTPALKNVVTPRPDLFHAWKCRAFGKPSKLLKKFTGFKEPENVVQEEFKVPESLVQEEVRETENVVQAEVKEHENVFQVDVKDTDPGHVVQKKVNDPEPGHVGQEEFMKLEHEQVVEGELSEPSTMPFKLLSGTNFPCQIDHDDSTKADILPKLACAPELLIHEPETHGNVTLHSFVIDQEDSNSETHEHCVASPFAEIVFETRDQWNVDMRVGGSWVVEYVPPSEHEAISLSSVSSADMNPDNKSHGGEEENPLLGMRSGILIKMRLKIHLLWFMWIGWVGLCWRERESTVGRGRMGRGGMDGGMIMIGVVVVARKSWSP